MHAFFSYFFSHKVWNLSFWSNAEVMGVQSQLRIILRTAMPPQTACWWNLPKKMAHGKLIWISAPPLLYFFIMGRGKRLMLESGIGQLLTTDRFSFWSNFLFIKIVKSPICIVRIIQKSVLVYIIPFPFFCLCVDKP